MILQFVNGWTDGLANRQTFRVVMSLSRMKSKALEWHFDETAELVEKTAFFGYIFGHCVHQKRSKY